MSTGNSPDFVPLERRRPGLTISSYRVAPDGIRYGATDPVTVDPDDVSVYDRHPGATWPACRCPQHRG